MAQFPWLNGARCAAALTFDEDGECVSLIDDPENARKRLTLQSEGAHGPNMESPRILDLLDKHDIKESFFTSGVVAERHPELGHHGYQHERPAFVDEDEEERIMIRGQEVLESITGIRPRGYRSPAWELKPTSLALIKKHEFLYDSSVMGDDEPYLIAAGPTDEKLLENPIQSMNDDWAYFGFSSIPALGNGISSPQAVFETWSEETTTSAAATY